MTKLWHKWISWIRAKQPMNTSKLQTRYSVIEYRYSSVPDPKGDKEKDGNLAYFNVIGVYTDREEARRVAKAHVVLDAQNGVRIEDSVF